MPRKRKRKCNRTIESRQVDIAIPTRSIAFKSPFALSLPLAPRASPCLSHGNSSISIPPLQHSIAIADSLCHYSQGLLGMLKEASTAQHISQFHGKTLAVDAYVRFTLPLLILLFFLH